MHTTNEQKKKKKKRYIIQPNKTNGTHFWSLCVGCSLSPETTCSFFTTRHGRCGTDGIFSTAWWNFCLLWMGVKPCGRQTNLVGSKYEYLWNKESTWGREAILVSDAISFKIYISKLWTRLSTSECPSHDYVWPQNVSPFRQTGLFAQNIGNNNMCR